MIPFAEIRKPQKDTQLHYLGDRERHAENSLVELSEQNHIAGSRGNTAKLFFFDYLHFFRENRKKEKHWEMYSSQSFQFGIILALIIFQEEQQIYNCQSAAVC